MQGASVFATAVPYNQFAVGQGTTGAAGTVVLTEARRSGFPVSRHQRLLAVFVRAWKQGEPVTGGVSSSRGRGVPLRTPLAGTDGGALPVAGRRLGGAGEELVDLCGPQRRCGRVLRGTRTGSSTQARVGTE